MSAPLNSPARAAARAVAATLRDAGFEAYFAGGCVRDRLLGLEPDDYDIATAATPEDVQRLFPKARGVGEAFGVMLVRSDRRTFEVATFRTDGEYLDGRRPASVRFGSAQDDALRRDFTINGLFEEPETGKVVDFVGGVRDLDRRVLRAIGDPAARFVEDHLRLLRAVRFAARYGLTIDESTADAIRQGGPRLAAIAKERIGMEVRRMLDDSSRRRAIELLETFALDGTVLGEAARRSLGARMARLAPGTSFPAALVAWGLDRVGADPDALLPPDRIAAWQRALALSNDEAELCVAVAHCRGALPIFLDGPEHRKKRLAAHPGFAGAMAIAHAEAAPAEPPARAWLAATDPASIAPTPFVTGDDLIALGLEPGPVFRDILEGGYDAQLDGEVRSREEALARLRRSVGRTAGS